MPFSSGATRDGQNCDRQQDAPSDSYGHKQRQRQRWKQSDELTELSRCHSTVLLKEQQQQQQQQQRQQQQQQQQELGQNQERGRAKANKVERPTPERRHVMVSAEPHQLTQPNELNQVDSHLLNRADETLKHAKANHEDDKRPLIELAKPGDGRKWSQCSGASQVSTSFGCSLGGSSSVLDASEGRRTSSIGAGLNQGHHQLRQDCRLTRGAPRKSSSIIDCFQSVVCEPIGVGNLSRSSNDLIIPSERCSRNGTPPRMDRSISQSMLELDESRLGPGDKFHIYWRNLTFGYEPTNVIARLGAKLRPSPSGQGQKLVLKHISGGFHSNQLVAIIGPSGCGKTTLLQFLAGTNKHQRERLRIRGLSEPKVAYIGQDDCLLPGLTARETLMYASRLQNGRVDFDHAHHIEPILQELGLTECAGRNVTKLSGGQAKRVTIAQQLLYPTNLLILDEVTSGLDASTSYSIVKLLKYLVSDKRYPMSIVMSIHQPSARLFAVFDHLYVMSAGCCLYEGSCELGQIKERLARFGLACPPYHNMADYLIELACASPEPAAATDHDKTAPMGRARPSDGPEGGTLDWRLLVGESEPVRTRAQLIQHQRQLHETEPSSLEGDAARVPDYSLYSAVELARQRRPRPLMYHFRTHLWRSLLRIRRSYILTYLQLATYILLGLQLATFYGHEIGQLGGCPQMPSNLMSYVLASGAGDGGGGGGGGHEQEMDTSTLEMRRIQENMNFLLVAVMLATFAALEITVITFPMEAKTIKREWSNGWYSVSSYFAGRTLADLPFQLAFVMLFCLLVYQMTGQLGLGTWRFGSFVAVITMTALAAQSFGFIFGALFMDNLPAAVFTAPIAIFPALLFSGFFSRVSQVPHFYKPMTYISHFRYAFDSLLVTLYGFDRCHCEQHTLDQYHSGMRDQTSSMRETFSYLFGASDCAPSLSGGGGGGEESQPFAMTSTASPAASAGIISQDDLSAISASNSTLAAQLFKTIVENAPEATTSSPLHRPVPPLATNVGFMKPLEDALVDSLMERLNSSSSDGAELMSNGTTPAPGDDSAHSGNVLDRLANQFAGRLTRMLNKQANFGRDMPRNCSQFNSYLMAEFELNDEDLIFGLLMLFLMVLFTRILCNYILNYTISRGRSK